MEEATAFPSVGLPNKSGVMYPVLLESTGVKALGLLEFASRPLHSNDGFVSWEEGEEEGEEERGRWQEL